MKRLIAVGILGAACAAPALAGGSADDDLAAVKRAVLASNASSQARPPAEDPTPPAEAKPRAGKGEPRWFRVRIVEKAGKRARVSVNLPLGLVRSVGDEWPLPSYHGCHRRGCGVTLGELLRSLDSGQSLVEIEDDEATVRVWVD